MKRTALVFILTAAGIIMSFSDAFFGLLLYTWYSFASPLELTYGSLEGTRLSMLVAAVVIGTALQQKKGLLVKHSLTVLCYLFALVCFCSLAYTTRFSMPQIGRSVENLTKIIFMACLAPALLPSLRKLRIFIWVVALSAGLLGAYYGVFGLFAGSRSIAGPARIGDNNGYAVFLVTNLAFIFYGGRHATFIKDETLRALLTFGLFCSNLVAIMLTFSRGGFLAAGLVFALIMLHVKNPVFKIISCGVILPVFFFLVSNIFSGDDNLYEIPTGASLEDSGPLETLDIYLSRLRTLQSAGSVDSANSRTHFWRVALLMAQDKPALGVGFGRYNSEYNNYDIELGKYGFGRSVHSTYFKILAETGFTGLAIFLLIIITCIVNTQRTGKICRLFSQHPESEELMDYSRMIKIAFAGYCSGSLFVSTLNHEMFWALISVTIALDLLGKEIRAKEIEKFQESQKSLKLFSDKKGSSGDKLLSGSSIK